MITIERNWLSFGFYGIPLCLLAALLVTSLARANEPHMGVISIVIKTDLGAINADLYPDLAPITVANFVYNIKEGLYRHGQFYRIVCRDGPTSPSKKRLSLIQGGKALDKKSRPPIAHESTRTTGLSHIDGVFSMASNGPGTASSEFFISIGENTILDYLNGKRVNDQDEPGAYPGFAAFGKVTNGMDIVRQIQNLPTGQRVLTAQEAALVETGVIPKWMLPQILNNSVSITIELAPSQKIEEETR